MMNKVVVIVNAADINITNGAIITRHQTGGKISVGVDEAVNLELDADGMIIPTSAIVPLQPLLALSRICWPLVTFHKTVTEEVCPSQRFYGLFR